MEVYTWLVDYVGLTTVLVFLVVFLVSYAGTRKPVGIPPGPPILVPGLGNIPNMIGKDPLTYFQDLRETYGDIYSIYIGSQLTIVLNGFPVIKDAMVNRSDFFSDRPKHDFIATCLKDDGGGVVYSNGNDWKRERNFAANALKNIGLRKHAFEAHVNAEMTSLVTLIESHQGQPFDMKGYILFTVANIISVLLTNKRFEHGDSMLQRYLCNQEHAMKKTGLASVVINAFPFLRRLPGDPFEMEVIKTNKAFVFEFFNTRYIEHVNTFDGNIMRDMLDYMLERDQTEEILQSSVATCSDIFAGGTDTTSNTLLWLIIYLTTNLPVQDKFRKEIHDGIGEERLPSLDDRAALPFVQATILEVMRLSPVVPFGVPHAVRQDTEFHGFAIPETATILTNIKSVLSDPTAFKDPEQFRPERFLDETGRFIQPATFMPFGIGPRVCLGEAAARIELFLIAVTIFQKFQLLPDEDNAPDREGVLGITYTPKPFKVRALRNH